MLKSEMSVRVEWGDCDPAKIVFYPRYFAWADAAGHKMLADAGLDHETLIGKYGVRGVVLAEVGMQFKTPSFFADSLIITSVVTRIGGASFEISHEFHRAATLILTGRETRVWATEAPDKPAGIEAGAIPDEVRAVLEGK